VIDAHRVTTAIVLTVLHMINEPLVDRISLAPITDRIGALGELPIGAVGVIEALSVLREVVNLTQTQIHVESHQFSLRLHLVDVELADGNESLGNVRSDLEKLIGVLRKGEVEFLLSVTDIEFDSLVENLLNQFGVHGCSLLVFVFGFNRGLHGADLFQV
jgi:hypothetical protein